MRQSNKSPTEGQTNKKSQNIKDKIRQQEEANMSKPQEEIAALKKHVIEWGQKHRDFWYQRLYAHVVVRLLFKRCFLKFSSLSL